MLMVMTMVLLMGLLRLWIYNGIFIECIESSRHRDMGGDFGDMGKICVNME
jgi:hypothetical protein